jgi:hypothetical protein
MWPCKQKDCQYESDAGGGKNPGLEPAELERGCFVHAGPEAPQKRRRYLGVGGDVNAGIDGSEEGLFLFECRAARVTRIELRAQMPLWLGTGGRGFDQRVFIMFAWHRNFSANCLRA